MFVKLKTSDPIEQPTTTSTTQAEINNSHQTSTETTYLTLQPPTPAVPPETDLESDYPADLLPQIQ